MEVMVWVPLAVAAHTNPAAEAKGLLPARAVTGGLLR